MPRVHGIAGLLKRWLLGTHQGAVEPQHLSYYLDEFTFRFNRRKSKSRGQALFPAHATGSEHLSEDLRYSDRAAPNREQTAEQQDGAWRVKGIPTCPQLLQSERSIRKQCKNAPMAPAPCAWSNSADVPGTRRPDFPLQGPALYNGDLGDHASSYTARQTASYRLTGTAANP